MWLLSQVFAWLLSWQATHKRSHDFECFRSLFVGFNQLGRFQFVNSLVKSNLCCSYYIPSFNRRTQSHVPLAWSLQNQRTPVYIISKANTYTSLPVPFIKVQSCLKWEYNSILFPAFVVMISSQFFQSMVKGAFVTKEKLDDNSGIGTVAKNWKARQHNE